MVLGNHIPAQDVDNCHNMSLLPKSQVLDRWVHDGALGKGVICSRTTLEAKGLDFPEQSLLHAG